MRLLERILDGVLKASRRGGRPMEPSGPVPLPGSAAVEDRSVTIHAGWLIDGSGGPIRRNVRIEIRNGLIQALEDPLLPSSGTPSSRAKPDLDLGSCTLLPGLIDSHVHLTMTGSVDETLRAHLRDAPYEIVRQMILENLREHLRCGVIAVRDGGGFRGTALRFSRSNAGQGQPVRVLAAGRAWHRPGATAV